MAATTRIRRGLKRVLLRLGLYGGFWKLRGVLIGWSPKTLAANRRWRRDHPDEPPIPPPRFIYDVINVYEIASFVASGRHAAEKIEKALDQVGRPLTGFSSVLDFGCGCGRIIRHWHHNDHAAWHGTDYNRELVAWCATHLDFASFSTNELSPPLAFGDASFDLIYANSVFTHLDEELQERWLQEILRVLRPTGVALLTTHGDAWSEGLDDDERRRYLEGELIVRSGSSSGSNLCEAYHPPAYFTRVAGELFAKVHHLPQGGPDRREQDIWVLEV